MTIRESDLGGLPGPILAAYRGNIAGVDARRLAHGRLRSRTCTENIGKSDEHIGKRNHDANGYNDEFGNRRPCVVAHRHSTAKPGTNSLPDSRSERPVTVIVVGPNMPTMGRSSVISTAATGTGPSRSIRAWVLRRAGAAID